MKNIPSMAALAKAAGVAKSTVSLALRNDPRVSEELRTRIHEIAESMGYQTNALVARLMVELRKGRKQRYMASIAAINAFTHRDIRKKVSHVNALMEGMEQRAEQLGYTLDNFWLYDPDLKPERLARILRARNIQGAIFYGIANEVCLQGYEGVWGSLPSVTVGSHLRHPALNFVMNDHHSAAMQACTQLRKAGYCRIGIVLDRWLDNVMEHRLIAGYHASFSEEEKRLPVLFLDDPQESPRPEGRKRFSAWVKKHHPDACICINRFILDWVRDLGIAIPNEMGVALLDLPGELKGSAAGIESRQEFSGMSGVDILVGQIHRAERGIPPFQRGTLIEGLWIPGPSVRDASSLPPARTKKKS